MNLYTYFSMNENKYYLLGILHFIEEIQFLTKIIN